MSDQYKRLSDGYAMLKVERDQLRQERDEARAECERLRSMALRAADMLECVEDSPDYWAAAGKLERDIRAALADNVRSK